MRLRILSLALVSLFLASLADCHPHRHKKRSHHQNLVPHPKNVDPSKMSNQELADLLNKLAAYVKSMSQIGTSPDGAQLSEKYLDEKRSYRQTKKASDVFNIASSLAMHSR